jgi:hypothetical protein
VISFCTLGSLVVVACVLGAKPFVREAEDLGVIKD